MLNKIKQIFGGYQKEIDELRQSRECYKIDLEYAQESVDALTKELDSLKQTMDKQSSTDPWFALVAEGLDPVKGIGTTLDWNEAFIQYLKDSGLTDGDEYIAIQKWIAILHEDTIEKIENRIIERSDIIKPSKFS